MTEKPQPEKPPVKQDAAKPESGANAAPGSTPANSETTANPASAAATEKAPGASSAPSEKAPASAAATEKAPGVSSAPSEKAPGASSAPTEKAPASAAPAEKAPAPKPGRPDEPKPVAPPNDPSFAVTTRDVREFSKEATVPSKSTMAERQEAKKEETHVSPASDSSKVAQRFPETSSEGAGQTAMQICPTCGHRNRPGILICDNCGTNLMTGSKSAVGTRDLVHEKEELKAESPGEKLLDTSQFRAIESAGGATFSEDMVLRIEIEGGTTPMMVYPKNEIIMGRRDPNTGGMPDVDLTSYAGYRMGVSRRHAAIRLQDKELNVSDLGSSNGTFLNGTRLTAHRPYQVRDGDEIRLGQMVLHVYFQSSKDKNRSK
jgi:FHA domain-containing protein